MRVGSCRLDRLNRKRIAAPGTTAFCSRAPRGQFLAGAGPNRHVSFQNPRRRPMDARKRRYLASMATTGTARRHRALIRGKPRVPGYSLFVEFDVLKVVQVIGGAVENFVYHNVAARTWKRKRGEEKTNENRYSIHGIDGIKLGTDSVCLTKSLSLAMQQSCGFAR